MNFPYNFFSINGLISVKNHYYASDIKECRSTIMKQFRGVMTRVFGQIGAAISSFTRMGFKHDFKGC